MRDRVTSWPNQQGGFGDKDRPSLYMPQGMHLHVIAHCTSTYSMREAQVIHFKKYRSRDERCCTGIFTVKIFGGLQTSWYQFSAQWPTKSIKDPTYTSGLNNIQQPDRRWQVKGSPLLPPKNRGTCRGAVQDTTFCYILLPLHWSQNDHLRYIMNIYDYKKPYEMPPWDAKSSPREVKSPPGCIVAMF